VLLTGHAVLLGLARSRIRFREAMLDAGWHSGITRTHPNFLGSESLSLESLHLTVHPAPGGASVRSVGVFECSFLQHFFLFFHKFASGFSFSVSVVFFSFFSFRCYKHRILRIANEHLIKNKEMYNLDDGEEDYR
jgi:hypothetical protein